MDEKNEINIQEKIQKNKISFYLITFYSGLIMISDLGFKYYLKDQKDMSASTFSKILLIFRIPYLIKPLFGLLIDFCPIFGYKKKIYLLLSFIINILSWYIFLFKNSNNNLIISIICYVFINITISLTTIIGAAIQIEISRIQDNNDENNLISKGTTNLMTQYFIIRSIGSLIPSYFKGFLIEEYTYDAIFYMSGFFSIFILISGIILEENKSSKNKINKIKRNIIFSPLIKPKKKDTGNNKIIRLINNKNILILLLLILILESSPSCASPLFYYEINVLGLNPKNLGLIDFASQISIIIVIRVRETFFNKYNFKSITFFVRILIFGSFFLIYLLIQKYTQQYISDFYLLVLTISLNTGLHTLCQYPYTLLSFKYATFGLEATTVAFCTSFCNLGNMIAEFIDSFLADYFIVTHYYFLNLGKLILIANIINLIPLIYVCVVPSKFFSTKKQNNSEIELVTLNDKNENNQNNEENNEEKNEEIIDNIIENIVKDGEDEDVSMDLNDLNLTYQNSYRYLFF